jgi:hypothetical protein
MSRPGLATVTVVGYHDSDYHDSEYADASWTHTGVTVTESCQPRAGPGGTGKSRSRGCQCRNGCLPVFEMSKLLSEYRDPGPGRCGAVSRSPTGTRRCGGRPAALTEATLPGRVRRLRCGH